MLGEVVRVVRMDCKLNVRENDARCLWKCKLPGCPDSLKFGFSRSGVEVLDPRIYILKRHPDNIVKVSLISLPVEKHQVPAA